jgi:uncharacterized protein (TIGR03435 family)
MVEYMRSGFAGFTFLIAAASIFAQVPPSGPAFDNVSIKRHIPGPGSRGFNTTQNQRPDGGFTMTNVPAMFLIARAYAGFQPADFVGLPEWARNERYDVSATSPLTQASADDRAAMMRALLADRFQLIAHIEKRPHDVYDLLLLRGDGRLGSGLRPIEKDCAPQIAAQRAAFEAGTLPQGFPDLNAPPPPCTLRSVRGRNDPSDRVEGEATMESLAQLLRMSSGRFVVDKTGLAGTYRVQMTFDIFASRRPPDVTPAPDAAPTVFTAIREQLGLKFESSRAELDTLIIDRLEKPSEN